MKHCTKCETSNSDAAHFCIKCGTKLNAAASREKILQPKSAVPAVTVPAFNKPSRRKLPLIPIVITLIGALLVCGVIYASPFKRVKTVSQLEFVLGISPGGLISSCPAKFEISADPKDPKKYITNARHDRLILPHFYNKDLESPYHEDGCVWLPDVEHKIKGTVVIEHWLLESDSKDPLVFKIDHRAFYVYQHGHGTATSPQGEVFELVGGVGNAYLQSAAEPLPANAQSERTRIYPTKIYTIDTSQIKFLPSPFSQSVSNSEGNNLLAQAEQGDAKAQNQLGDSYANDAAVLDYNEAVKWYRKAADQGLAMSEYHLATCYANGRGLPKNFMEAAKWFRKAADQGLAEAQYCLGIYYENGAGVGKDLKTAYGWLILAAAAGNDKAPAATERVKKKITSEKVQEASNWAKDWKPIVVIQPTKHSAAASSNDGVDSSTVSAATSPSAGNHSPAEKPKQNILPPYKSELQGTNPVRVRNPNDFTVTAGIRAGENGKNFVIPANGENTVNVPDGEYDIYFIYSDKPNALFKGDSFAITSEKIEIQIVKSVDGNYGIRQVK